MLYNIHWNDTSKITFALGTWTYTLRYEIFSCTCTPTWCHAIRSYPPSGLGGEVGWVDNVRWLLAQGLFATLWDLFLHMHTDMMPCYQIISCTSTPTWCDPVRYLLLLFVVVVAVVAVVVVVVVAAVNVVGVVDGDGDNDDDHHGDEEEEMMMMMVMMMMVMMMIMMMMIVAMMEIRRWRWG